MKTGPKILGATTTPPPRVCGSRQLTDLNERVECESTYAKVMRALGHDDDEKLEKALDGVCAP